MSETTLTVETITLAAQATEWVRAAQADGARVGLVPTMGALHEGHLSLARAAREECDRVVATVFVNPTQFAPHEDYGKYPRDLDTDRAKLASVGVDLLFAPGVDEVYPKGDSTTIDVGPIAQVYEGAARPTHYRGVATVVMKLLQIAPADRMYLGQKDYQQTVVLQRMARDLFVPTEVVVCPTVREADGLAMSSRNRYLAPDDRAAALVLSRTLRSIAENACGGERRVATLRAGAETLLESEPSVEVDYLEFFLPGTVTPAERAEPGVVVAVAARVSGTRLIDNVILA